MANRYRRLQQERIKKLKVKFLKYYGQLPVQKLAAQYVGRNEDTIITWKNKDPEFAESMENAKAKWALKNSKKVRSKEWLLERVIKSHFSPPTQKVEGNQTLSIKLINGGYISQPKKINASSKRGHLPKPKKVQGVGVAQKSKKNNNRDK